ncbi:zona pellucida sperm-binding protein 4-like [Synchiropus picturatus]
MVQLRVKDGAKHVKEVLPQTKGHSASSSSSHDPEADDGFQIETDWDGDTEVAEYVEPIGVEYTYSAEIIPITDIPEACGYTLDPVRGFAVVSFGGCYVKRASHYSLQLQFTNELGQSQTATISCGPPRRPKMGVSHGTEPVRTPKCSKKVPLPTLEADDTAALNCMYPTEERVTCGQKSMTQAECESMGCCADPYTSLCYYPLDECTKDRHFVFAIRHDSASIPIDPTKLVTPGASCYPVFVTEEVAIFKFGVTECGTRAYTVGKTQVYLAEVQTLVLALNLKFGVITRTDPVRFLIECRYSSEESPYAMESVGYMVKTPSLDLPLHIVSDVSYSVQLRIAQDETYTEYMPTHHPPLHLLLGKPVYLELNLNNADPDSVLVVNYCVAYPRSAKNAMVMVYEGCTNPNDKTVTIIPIGDTTNRYQRRFVITAFQFLDQSTNKYLDEEIYFMCSTEVCRPAEKDCDVQCFDGMGK